MGSAIFASLLADAGPQRRGLVTGLRVVGRRAVPAGRRPRPQRHPERRGRLSQLGLDRGKVYRVEGPTPARAPRRAPTAYAKTVARARAGQFDVVLLGVGPDGHVASLFPHHPAQRDDRRDRRSPCTTRPKPPPDRVSPHLRRASSGRARSGSSWPAPTRPTPRPRRSPRAPDRWDVPASGVGGPVATPVAARRGRRANARLTAAGAPDSVRAGCDRSRTTGTCALSISNVSCGAKRRPRTCAPGHRRSARTRARCRPTG